MAQATTPLRQRADLTFKHNRERGRHGWLRLTPAYSIKIVDAILAQHDGERLSVYDPFSGTGTTALAAAMRGHDAHASDINPFLIWFGRAKTRRYSAAQLRDARDVAGEVAEEARADRAPVVDPPRIHNVERWWNPDRLSYLCRLKSALERACRRPSAKKDLLLVAFSRSVIALSNAAFNHQSMSFKDTQAPTKRDQELLASAPTPAQQFAADVDYVLDSAGHNPTGSVSIHEQDSRSSTHRDAFDLVVTSPPYPNRMSYIRELRPYMYWLGYLVDKKDAGDLDWEAVGGTWGSATSKLSDWEPGEGAFESALLDLALAGIRRADNRSAEVLARYVHKYFVDMNQHFQAVRAAVRSGGTLHYVIGNSTFYGNLVPAETLYQEMMLGAGFSDVGIEVIRKRNSKKELFEFEVSARG
jgi:hypothetical protein